MIEGCKEEGRADKEEKRDGRLDWVRNKSDKEIDEGHCE